MASYNDLVTNAEYKLELYKIVKDWKLKIATTIRAADKAGESAAIIALPDVVNVKGITSENAKTIIYSDLLHYAQDTLKYGKGAKIAIVNMKPYMYIRWKIMIPEDDLDKRRTFLMRNVYS